MNEQLRDRLIDHIARLHVPHVRPVNGQIRIDAVSLADALLPFILDEMAWRPPTQDAYDAACAALWKHRDRAQRFQAALAELVTLKDGPRDEHYRAAKDAAWDRARALLHHQPQ